MRRNNNYYYYYCRDSNFRWVVALQNKRRAANRAECNEKIVIPAERWKLKTEKCRARAAVCAIVWRFRF